MKKLKFKISCVPPKATSQQKGVIIINGKPRYFKKKHVAAAEQSMTALLMPHRPQKPFCGALRLSIIWTYPWRKSETKRNRALGWMPSDKRPDCSNLVKMFEDCMTRLNFFVDDSQVADLRFVKGWGDDAGISVELEEFVCVYDSPDVFRDIGVSMPDFPSIVGA